MSPLPHILVVEDSEITLFKLKAILIRLGFTVTTYADPVAALAWLRKTDSVPNLIISDVNMPGMDGYELIRNIRSSSATRNIPIILLTSQAEINDKIAGLQAGADDYLSKTISPAELELRVKALLSRSGTNQGAYTQAVGKTITVFSLRGGVGKTTLAVNLSIALAQLWGIEVSLWDMSLTGGHCAMMLNLNPTNSLTSLAEVADITGQDDSIFALLMKHNSGIRLMPAPLSPADAELVTTKTIDMVWPHLQSTSAYIVIDGGHTISDTSLTILERSDLILLTLAPDLASIKSASDALEIFKRLGIDSQKILLVVNNIFPHHGLPTTKISSVLGGRAIIEIPYDSDSLIPAITAGRPFITINPREEIGLVMTTLAYRLSIKEMEKKKKDYSSPLLDSIRKRIKNGLQSI